MPNNAESFHQLEADNEKNNLQINSVNPSTTNEEPFDLVQYINNNAYDTRIVILDEFGIEEIEVHRKVICHASPVLANQVQELGENDAITIIYDRDAVIFMFDVIYANHPEIQGHFDVRFIIKIYELAEKYMVHKMTKNIQDYIVGRSMPSNSIQFYELGLKHLNVPIAKAAVQEIVLSTRNVLTQAPFLFAGKETVQAIVDFPHLSITYEELNYAIWSWGRQQLLMEGIRLLDSRIRQVISEIIVPPKQYSYKYRFLLNKDEVNPDNLRGFRVKYQPF